MKNCLSDCGYGIDIEKKRKQSFNPIERFHIKAKWKSSLKIAHDQKVRLGLKLCENKAKLID